MSLSDSQLTALKLVGCYYEPDEDGLFSGFIWNQHGNIIFWINEGQRKWRYAYPSTRPGFDESVEQVLKIIGAENCTHN